MRWLTRGIDWSMGVLFAFAAVVQFNDADPVRWVAIYGAAGSVSVMAALGRRIPVPVVLALGGAALVWGLVIVSTGPLASEYTHMFDAWEMKSLRVEEAREASGLLIIAAWMWILFLRTLRSKASRG